MLRDSFTDVRAPEQQHHREGKTCCWMLRLIREDVKQGLGGDRWNVFDRGCSRSGQFKVGSTSDRDRDVEFRMTILF